MVSQTPPRGLALALLWVLGGLMALIGLAIGIGGAYLVSLGGSWYFLLMGIVMLISAVLILRKKVSGLALYALAFICSIFWAISDAGMDFWPLFSRLFTFAVLAFLAAIAWPILRAANTSAPVKKAPAYGIAAILAVCMLVSAGWMFVPQVQVAATEDVPVKPVSAGDEQKDWKHWGNTTHGDRFAALDQINKGNVSDLKVAWVAHTGDIPQSNGSGAEDQNTPLQVGDTLFVCTPYSKVLALDVDSGKEKWRFDSKATAPNWQRCRGLGYFEETTQQAAATLAAPAQPAACPRRLFLPTTDARLLAINADNGKLCDDFGDHGTVDLKVGMGEVKPGYYQQTSTPLVAGNVVVVGGRVADNFSTGEPPGVVRAYDVHTGKLAWAWDPGNPAITGLPPEGQTYTRGTPNVWSAMSYDAKLGLIYLPTGNATPDFFGGTRTAEDDKYSSSIVAVDAATGQVRWHYQTTHHDLWDFDLPSQPLLYDLPDAKGGTTPVIVQTSKQGMIFMLNRETGEPVAKVEERPVPQGNIEGERYSKTQPYSVGMPMIGNETLTESDMWGATPIDLLICRIEFKGMRHEGVFTPPGLDRSLQYPGSLGGMNWGSVSVDPNNSLMFVNDMRLGLANYMVPRANVAKDASGIEMGIVPMDGTPFGAMRERFLSPLGIPCQKPPFGTMSAVDLKSGKIVWQVPVGTVQDTGPLGIRMHMPIPIGMPTLGATLSTQSGLLFFAGTQDFYLRAFDTANGKEIWKSRLPVGSQSGPMTYVSPKTGKQYIVINAGGARQSPDRGDYIIAYALPDTK
ncbi:glucose/quinate/shikimate family membrane-bound PQQ-dependent dehydrogenase [Enterobacteriaceae bacterium H20N1]|uniref:Glucose/quinate/shikimate family membrane-bound PQQ-dependent dehydrogenase n=1 Tax=Dryocola boscaweniae TaxID=2925397 RepID=A0A9X2WB89_9ENTR|nr:glucose/quinate/shikimate family membrane-bound PQQ-dependent dehydrogenase [Dryocola boscaweniae]MCT4703981.1 glucose/quinate/shikimate family membrane-bound PQQ-dependent dehydrogenase [Dryocola boscaweniae]MCT4721149.1 glucose/quinate/shikimate family membrane-bound PQQ-dependent dehydrogenase [Dryocola boscaweniae]